MLITEKILECCYYYSLCDKKTTNAMNYIKGISRTTFNKYVLIGEMLDYNLLILLQFSVLMEILH